MTQPPTIQQSSDQDRTSRGIVPKTVTGAAFAFLVLASINLLALILFLIHRGEVADTYKHMYPKLLPGQIDALVNNLLLSGAIPHIIFAVLLTWLALMIGKGRSWVRVVATLVIAIEMVAHVFSLAVLLVLPAEAPAILVVEAVGLLLELSVLWLLWFSRSSRTYFAMRKHQVT